MITEGKGIHMLVRVQRLFLPVDHPFFYQFHHDGREGFGMNAQIFVIHELRCDRVGKIPEAQLDGRFVGDHFSDDPADGPVEVIRLRGRRFPYRLKDRPRHNPPVPVKG